MITLFDQNRKYYNRNKKKFHLVPPMVLEAGPLAGTKKPLNSFPGSLDRHARATSK